MLNAPADVVRNEVFNVGNTEENYRIRELADIVVEIVPGCRIEYAADGGPDKRCYRVTCNKIERVLGFKRNGQRVKARRNCTRQLSPSRTYRPTA